MLLGFGGMTIYRRPVAFVMAMLRRSICPRDLTLFGFTHGYEADLLVGAGCAAAVRSCYFGLESFGFAPMFTERVNRGEVRVIEETEAEHRVWTACRDSRDRVHAVDRVDRHRPAEAAA
ncbi:MAG: hypothetical protein HND48_05805 [Chloroflexi bacterium]|nr:hypothetical protein [Chloroflexota bacterium]